ncbi:MAG: parallel beta-helix domain-containing protein [Bacteroidota bacterium]|nr:parallel beta-helix domain-containing protein [Ferruginibacter sp.]
MKTSKLTRENYVFPGTTYALLILFIILFAACKKDLAPTPENDRLAVGQSANGKEILPVINVLAGGSIQAAVNAASGPTIIKVAEGTYREAIVVEKPGIQIIGDGEVIIDNPGGANDGVRVRDAGDGFVLKHVTIQNFIRYGVIMIRADNFVLDHVITINDGEYGLFPIRCNNGIISHCVATGHTDSGIYVGQSSDLEIMHCTAYGNVSGYEIENCSRVVASFNKGYDNAAGALVFLLPGLNVKTSTDITLSNNNFSNNNRPNFSPPGSGFENYIPSGSGILIVGSNNTVIEKNIVNNNNFVGIATVSTLVLGALAGIPPADILADIEPDPDGVRIIQNSVRGNGSAPPAGLPLPAADLLWDGSGTNNCWSDNKYSTSFPSALPACN